MPARNPSTRPEEKRSAPFMCCDAIEVESPNTPLHLEICAETEGGRHFYVRRKPEVLHQQATATGRFATIGENMISAVSRSKLAVVAASMTLQFGHTPWLARLWHISELRFLQQGSEASTAFDRPFIGCPKPKPGDMFVM